MSVPASAVIPEPAGSTDLDKPLPGPKIILMGDSGTGKTTALKTLIQAGITPMILFLEQGMESVTDLPKGSYHYHYIKPMGGGWLAMAAMAKSVLNLSFENLTKIQDNNRSKNTGFMDAMTICNDFVDETGKHWGDVAKWGTDKAFCIDGLSGLSDLAMAMTTGIKPTRHQGEWGVAMNMVKGYLQTLVADTFCTVALISHTEREKDEITGGTFVTVKTLGQKLAPDIPKMFSDVILAERAGNKFSWNTAASNAVTKTRNLEIKSGLDPSFVPLINSWKAKGGKILTTAP